MKTFDELFKEAATISDKRNSVLFQLIDKTEKEVVPAFAKVMKGFGLKNCFFSLSVKPFCGDFPAEMGYNECELWHFGINSDGCIDICSYDEEANRYTIKETYRLESNNHKEVSNLPVIKLTRIGIMSVLSELTVRIEKMNTKYTAQIEKAEGLLNEH